MPEDAGGADNTAVDLAEALDALRACPPSWSASAATENLRCVVPEDSCDLKALADFLAAAAAICLDHARTEGVSPATFYAWYDEQAGQLRFSAAACAPDDLPFGAAVRLVAEPLPIAKQTLASPRGGIPLTELKGVASTEGDTADAQETERPVFVWARTDGQGLEEGPR